jgi:uncharacterized phage-associated protein
MLNKIINKLLLYIDSIFASRGEGVVVMSNYIKFNINLDKTIEVILWFSNKNPGITYHSLLKLLFYAEEYHLNKYGRPIIGDRYKAMDYGPVASMTYDFLKKNKKRKEIAHLIDDLPFDNTGKKEIFPKRECNSYFLSKSDIEALSYSFENYKDYNFNDNCDKTHDHPAWKNARNRTHFFWEGNSPYISYSDFFSSENKDIAEELIRTSEYLSL